MSPTIERKMEESSSIHTIESPLDTSVEHRGEPEHDQRNRQQDGSRVDDPLPPRDNEESTEPQKAIYSSTAETDFALNYGNVSSKDQQPTQQTNLAEEDEMMDTDGKNQDQEITPKMRWRRASQRVRERTAQLAERLGRTPDAGEALDATLLPENFGATDDIEMVKVSGDQSDIETGHEKRRAYVQSEARRLVRRLGSAGHHVGHRTKSSKSSDGPFPPDPDSELPEPAPASGGVLSQLLRLYGNPINASTDTLATESDGGHSRTASGTMTPKSEKPKWYNKSKHTSTSSLVHASMGLSRAALPASTDVQQMVSPPNSKKKKKNKNGRLEEEIRVTLQIAEILARQRYIMQLCRAFMKYGAPTHRLEEYMQTTARVLGIDGQFLYLPGCMIMSFDDRATRTAEVKLIRLVQGLDLSRLADTHTVYKNVVHDVYGVEEAIQELDEISKRKPRFSKWILIPLYGVASACVGPFAFSARPIDMPFIFILGCLLGFMQHFIAPKSSVYSNVFEVSAAILTSFLARAFGSIRVKIGGEEQYLFCFSAMAQSSIALILPGFLVLSSSLELQSHQIVPGAIRIVYAIIYSLFLGYGVTVGTTIYGLIDSGATSKSTCSGLSVWGNQYAQHFPFVAMYIFLAAVINQAKWKQIPAMLLIGVSGYITNYAVTMHLGSTSEVANTVGAFTIGVLGNLYSRLWHGHAAIAIIPGIFTMVPSGLASSGSILSGLEYANAVRAKQAKSTAAISGNSLVSLGFSMIQIAIGISVGLFIAALVVYPYGKRRSGLFSF